MISANILRKAAKSALNGTIDPVSTGIDTLLSVSQSMIKKDENELLGYKISATGKMLGFVGAGIASASSAIDTRNTNDMGMITGRMYRAVPSYAGYMPQQGMGDISAGASGDLVFALHNQRGGGRL